MWWFIRPQRNQEILWGLWLYLKRLIFKCIPQTGPVLKGIPDIQSKCEIFSHLAKVKDSPWIFIILLKSEYYFPILYCFHHSAINNCQEKQGEIYQSQFAIGPLNNWALRRNNLHVFFFHCFNIFIKSHFNMFGSVTEVLCSAYLPYRSREPVSQGIRKGKETEWRMERVFMLR